MTTKKEEPRKTVEPKVDIPEVKSTSLPTDPSGLEEPSGAQGPNDKGAEGVEVKEKTKEVKSKKSPKKKKPGRTYVGSI